MRQEDLPSPEALLGALVLGACQGGSADALFGEKTEHVAAGIGPYLVSRDSLNVFLECPLLGSPRLDATLLYADVDDDVGEALPDDPTIRQMLAWYAPVRRQHPSISCGLEFDEGDAGMRRAGIHFQPREHTELVSPFMHSVGQEGLAERYLELSQRMPKGWPLSYLGFFDGRDLPGLRVAGYLAKEERQACATDPSRLAAAFDAIGFEGYDAAMLDDVAQVLALAPHEVDFQFDVVEGARRASAPLDGPCLGEDFSLNVALRPATPADARECMEHGAGARLCKLLQDWGMADERWREIASTAWLKALPWEGDEGSAFLLSVMPRWIKIRWQAGQRVPAKAYLQARAGVL